MADITKHGSVALTASASGATAVVAAVTNKRIRVTSVALMANAAVNVKFQSGSTDLTGLYYLAANTGFALAHNDGPTGWFMAATSTALNINLSGNVAVGGVLNYEEVG